MNNGSTTAPHRLPWFLGLCFALRAGVGLWLAIVHPERFLGGDGNDYLVPARNIVAGHGYAFNAPRVWDWAAYDPSLSEAERLRPKPETFRPPLYSILLAGIVALTSNPFPMVAILNALCAVVAAWFLFDLARRALTQRTAEWAVLLYAVYPIGVALTARVGVEALFEALLCGTAWSLWRTKETRRATFALLAGILLGLAALTRSNGIFVWPLACLWLYCVVPARRFTLVCLVGMVVLTLSPWAIRNRIVTGHWIVLSASGPYNLWLGNNVTAYAMFTAKSSEQYNQWGKELLEVVVPAKVRELGTDDFGRTEEFWKSEAIGFILADKTRWCHLVLVKSIEFWRPYVRPGFFPDSMVILSLVAMLPLLVAGAAGLILLLRHHAPLGWLLLAIVLAGMSGLVLSHVHVRLRVPFVDTFFTVCAAHGVVTYWPRRSNNA